MRGHADANRAAIYLKYPIRDFSHIEQYIHDGVLSLDTVVRTECLFEDAMDVLLSTFPGTRSQDIVLKQLKGGITNKLLLATRVKEDPSGEGLEQKQVVLIRIYGEHSETFIDRSKELINAVSLNEFELAPKIFSRFKNGFVYAFTEGVALSARDLQKDHLAKLIAEKIAEWHNSPLAGENVPHLFDTLKKWYKNVPSVFKKPQDQKMFESLNMGAIWEILLFIENLACIEPTSPVVFCHNDLLAANIIYNATTDKVAFIDFEYGDYNYRGFDIANHFCEYAGFECLYDELYPSISTQKLWISRYLKAFRSKSVSTFSKGPRSSALPYKFDALNHVLSDSSTNNSSQRIESCYLSYNSDLSLPSEEDILSVLKEVCIFTLASHLYWSLWALVQASVSDIDFDYMGYAVKRLLRLNHDLDANYPDFKLRSTR
jgi:ethanolamine kinase